MRIIIVGCGKVGSSIASELNLEGHEISVVDINHGAVDKLANSLDVLGIEGNGATYDVLIEAGAEYADLLIAATARDEINLYSCLMAKAAGVTHTIARVRNPEYTNDLYRIKEHLGLSMAINPEQTAANEISRLLRFSGALEIDSFSKGVVELIKVTVPQNSSIVGTALNRVDNLRGKVRICTVAIGRSKDVILLGGGKVSFYLAKTLIKSGANVKIIEKNPERCNFLSEAMPEAVIIQGDCMDQSLLLSEGVEHADGIAALMDYDEENIIITMYLKGITKAKLITKVNNASFDPLLHDQNFECIIHPKSLTGEYIARYIRAMQNTGDSNVESLYRLNDDKVEALEFKVNAESRVTNVPIMNLNLKANLQIICINRGGKIILPQGTDVIKPEDTVIVLTMQKGLSKLEDIVKR